MAGLANGTEFPPLEFARVGGGPPLRLPDDLAGGWGVVLGYRGSWCPYCMSQLASFQRRLPKLSEAGISVAGFSCDDQEQAAATVAEHGLTFPVGYGADYDKVRRTLGSYVHPTRPAIESTNFVLSADRQIVVATYSSRAIGRLVPDDVIGLVKHIEQLAPTCS